MDLRRLFVLDSSLSATILSSNCWMNQQLGVSNLGFFADGGSFCATLLSGKLQVHQPPPPMATPLLSLLPSFPIPLLLLLLLFSLSPHFSCDQHPRSRQHAQHFFLCVVSFSHLWWCNYHHSMLLCWNHCCSFSMGSKKKCLKDSVLVKGCSEIRSNPCSCIQPLVRLLKRFAWMYESAKWI